MKYESHFANSYSLPFSSSALRNKSFHSLLPFIRPVGVLVFLHFLPPTVRPTFWMIKRALPPGIWPKLRVTIHLIYNLLYILIVFVIDEINNDLLRFRIIKIGITIHKGHAGCQAGWTVVVVVCCRRQLSDAWWTGAVAAVICCRRCWM
jgi:hypothetical protein